MMTIVLPSKRNISHYVNDELSQSKINIDGSKVATFFQYCIYLIHTRIRFIHQPSNHEVEDKSYDSVHFHPRSCERDASQTETIVKVAITRLCFWCGLVQTSHISKKTSFGAMRIRNA